MLGREHIRAYQLHLTQEKKLAPGSITIAVSALRFLYNVTLHRDWKLEDIIPAPKKPQNEGEKEQLVISHRGLTGIKGFVFDAGRKLFVKAR